MITVAVNRLEFYFNEVHWGVCSTIEFQRTLRVPDDCDYRCRWISVVSPDVQSSRFWTARWKRDQA